jgi:hypothetical protein
VDEGNDFSLPSTLFAIGNEVSPYIDKVKFAFVLDDIDLVLLTFGSHVRFSDELLHISCVLNRLFEFRLILII